MQRHEEVLQLSEEQLTREYAAEQAEEGLGKGPLKFTKPSGSELNKFKKNRIWLKNSTGCDLMVYVHRFFKIEQVLEEAYKLSAGNPGTVSAEVALKRALEQGLTQEFNIPATHKDQVKVYLGPGSGGAYVTARALDSNTTLFGKNITVNGGKCYVIHAPSYEDKVLTQ